MLQEALNARQNEELQKSPDLPPPRAGSSSWNRGSGHNRRPGAPTLPQPLRSWGVLAGREFGDPDDESDTD